MSKLKIAYVSYEYPPDIGQGGIATYIGQIASAMSKAGHYVEIFAGSPFRNLTEEYQGILTHRVQCNNPDEFRENVVKKFDKRHRTVSFDVLECAEINADGARIKELIPSLPLVVKLHTPSYIIIKLLYSHTSNLQKLRFLIGNLKNGKWRPWGQPDLKKDRDYIFSKVADVLLSPSLSLKTIICKDWKLKQNHIELIPNPYKPSSQLLSIPTVYKNEVLNILFIGKLNVHKGAHKLAGTIPAVKKRFPEVKYTFVGSDGPAPNGTASMQAYISERYSHYTGVHFIGPVSLESIPDYLSRADICVFPSLWENFPYVCLEAMSAGRAVIGSKFGGMQDMLSDNAGILVNPNNTSQIEKAIIKLLEEPKLRRDMGEIARLKVLNNYNHDIISDSMTKIYHLAIEKKESV